MANATKKMDVDDIRSKEVIEVKDVKNQVLSNSNMQASGSHDQIQASTCLSSMSLYSSGIIIHGYTSNQTSLRKEHVERVCRPSRDQQSMHVEAGCFFLFFYFTTNTISFQQHLAVRTITESMVAD